MTLFDDGKIAIKAAINEAQPKEANPTVPYGPEEVAAEAVACASAGAAVVHFHSRLDDGTQALQDDGAGATVYRRALELTAALSDVIMEPTNYPRGNDPTLAVDTPHLWSLIDTPPAGARLEVANIDGFRLGRAGWNEAAQRLVNFGGSGDRYSRPEVVRQVVDHGVVPFFGLFDLGETRLLAAMAATGLVPHPVVVQLNFFADKVIGPTPGVPALQAFLDEWAYGGVDAEVWLFVQAMPDRDRYDALLSAAIELGVHIRVGLGDNPHLFSRNHEMVEHAVELAGKHGLTPASPAELRKRLNIPAATWP
jgi:uncharacterized protein (DUF849 family)